MSPPPIQLEIQMALKGGGPGPTGGGGGAGRSKINKRGRDAGSGPGHRDRVEVSRSQGRVSRGTGIYSNNGRGRPVIGEVKTPMIDSSIIFVRHLNWEWLKSFLVSNSRFRDEDDRYDSIEDYLPREPPPVEEYLQLEKNYQEMSAKERQLAVARWLSGIGLRPLDGDNKG